MIWSNLQVLFEEEEEKTKFLTEPVLPLSHLQLPLKWQQTLLHLWKKSFNLSQKHHCSLCHWVNVACPGNQIGTSRTVDDFLRQCNLVLELVFVLMLSVPLLWEPSGRSGGTHKETLKSQGLMGRLTFLLH